MSHCEILHTLLTQTEVFWLWF